MLGIVALFLGGCLAIKQDFRPASTLASESTVLEAGFIERRCGIVISGENMKVTETVARFRFDSANGTEPPEPSFGIATAVDRRGYFVTAGHNLGDATPYILLPQPVKVRAFPAEVLYRCAESDIAILKIGTRLPAAFELAEPPSVGAPCFAGALAEETIDDANPNEWKLMIGSLNARILEVSPTRIVHDASLRTGDSGGPMVDRKGSLIGINVQMRTRAFPPLGKSYAARLDPALVARVIEARE